MDSNEGAAPLSDREQKLVDRLLMGAVESGELFWIEAYLAEGGNPNQVARKGNWEADVLNEAMKEKGEQSALMLALPHGAEVVGRLLSAGADPKFASSKGYCDSVLHVAADHGGSVAKALLDAGADPLVRDALGKTPLQRAVEYSMGDCSKQIEAGEAMISHGMPQKALDLALRSACANRPKQRRWIAPLAAAGADIKALAKGFEESLTAQERSAFEGFELGKQLGEAPRTGPKRV